MNKLGRGHRDKLQQFVSITGASEKVALQALKASDWHLEGAFDVFYSQPQIKSFTDTRRLEELYNQYKDPYADMILADGITHLCSDLQVDPQDIVMLVISWHMKAATMCEFSKQEFIGGLQSLGIDSLEKFRDRIPFIRSELKDEQKFREIYIFAFGWAKEKGQKSLALDTAIGMWQLLFAEKQWPLIDHWCQFLQIMYCPAGQPLLGWGIRRGSSLDTGSCRYFCQPKDPLVRESPQHLSRGFEPLTSRSGGWRLYHLSSTSSS